MEEILTYSSNTLLGRIAIVIMIYTRMALIPQAKIGEHLERRLAGKLDGSREDVTRGIAYSILLMKRRLHMPGRKIVGFLTRKRIWFHILRMAIVIAVSRSIGLIVDWNLPGTSLRGSILRLLLVYEVSR